MGFARAILTTLFAIGMLLCMPFPSFGMESRTVNTREECYEVIGEFYRNSIVEFGHPVNKRNVEIASYVARQHCQAQWDVQLTVTDNDAVAKLSAQIGVYYGSVFEALLNGDDFKRED